MSRTAICIVDQQRYEMVDGMQLIELEPQLRAAVEQDFPRAHDHSFICSEHLVHYRLAKMDKMIAADYRENDKVNKHLSKILAKNSYQVVDAHEELEESLTFGQRIADGVAQFGGSWAFIISFVAVMLAWMIINVIPIFTHHFDPYPFILLNLFLSMVAAIQAPLIMMSQNRAAEYDRLEARNDFRVNAKSEEEIRVLHSKVDHLIQQDEPNMLEIQKMQTEMLGEIQAQVNELRRLQPKRKRNQQ
ncbi:DUF1003 domain-containing protein [Lactiplantibacillus garii]|uniref:DUF1003 domain-containing protein n=1 Tax=Lactiplantibacillus garii TaxID=2306423 RepID=A0A426D8C1_9LACO|nr:DUF1003 domain-containing protein [Lactiplantibacillus garii]RRK10843.1 DUF1003 domain-containing protein [Lactiplantibacillus garii]